MTYTEVIYLIGDLATDSFAALRAGNNFINWSLIFLGMGLTVWWMGQMFKYDKTAEEEGGLK